MDSANTMTELAAIEEIEALRRDEAEDAYVPEDAPRDSRPSHEDWLRQAH